MNDRLVIRAATVGRAGAAAILAVALAASMQSPRAGPTVSIVAGLALATSATVVWSTRAVAVWRALALAASGAFLVAANGVPDPPTSLTFAVARAAGPLAVAAAAASILPWRAAIAGMAGGVVAGVVHFIVFDPFLDLDCTGCQPFDAVPWPDDDLAETVWTVGWVVLLGALLVGIRRNAAFVVPTTVLAGAYAMDPTQPLWLIGGVLAASVIWLHRWWRLRRRRLKLNGLLRSYQLGGEQLTDVLRAELGDPSLIVGYPMGDGFVAINGEEIITAGRSGTDIESSGQLIARILHDVELPPDVSTMLDPVTVLSLARHRATAQLAAEVRQLVTRRGEVARAVLLTRAGLERDLHDGVQQEVLALGLDIRLRIDRRTAAGLDASGLNEALRAVHECVDQLRAISTGVSPPMLTTHGLRGAVGALARRHGSTVDLGSITDQRFSDEVEQAAFAALSEALVRGATDLSARLDDGSVLILCAAGPARLDPTHAADDPPVDTLTDLFAALGGSLSLDQSRLDGVLPCES